MVNLLVDERDVKFVLYEQLRIEDIFQADTVIRAQNTNGIIDIVEVKGVAILDQPVKLFENVFGKGGSDGIAFDMDGTAARVDIQGQGLGDAHQRCQRLSATGRLLPNE